MTGNIFNIKYGERGELTWLSREDDKNHLNFVDGKNKHGTPYGRSKFISAQEYDGMCKVKYEVGGLVLTVYRALNADGYAETYIFENKSVKTVSWNDGDLGIFTPINDSYEASEVCMRERCHAHIWCGENSSYIYTSRMDGSGLDIALLVTKGSIFHYAVERANNSNDRGDFALLLSAGSLEPNEKYEVEFTFLPIFSYENFILKASAFKNILTVKGGKFACNLWDRVTYRLNKPATIKSFGSTYQTVATNGHYEAEVRMKAAGEHRIEIFYGENKRTHIDVFVMEDAEAFMRARLDFIIDRQQCNDNSKYHGAYLLYDNETEQKFVSKKAFCDHTAGRERAGMANSVLAALLGRINIDRVKYNESIRRAVMFFDKNIVGKRGRMWDNARKRGLIVYERIYNSAWYALCFLLTAVYADEKYYFDRAYGILKHYYKKNGSKFYAINMPVTYFCAVADKFSAKNEKEEMIKNFVAHGDNIIKNGSNYPAHEVKYEQSIVAPSVDMLLECYMLTKEKKYLDEAERQLRLLECFNGHQPSFRYNDISIRHWDGFWFGKRKLYGDTFPHYWSDITAMVFSKYAFITGQEAYQKRADNCLLSNFCLIQNGRGSCAYVAPYKVNGESGAFYDPWANDQDWVIYYYLMFSSEFGLYYKNKPNLLEE